MKEKGLYSTDLKVIEERVGKAGLPAIFSERSS
jgi:hypothetical protein